MKTTLNTILRTGAAAAVLAFASTGAMAASNLSANLLGQGVFTADGGGFGAGTFDVTPGVWQVTYNSNTFMAYCIDPVVALNASANHYTTSKFVASNAVKRLYEGYYKASVAHATTDYTTAQSFQLALWELNNDAGAANGNSSLLQGQLRFDDLTSDPIVANANLMLGTALGNGVIHNTFKYTELSSNGGASQSLLSVSAVPEAQTWAMLAAGLGLMAFMRRRRA